jgi:hypothetical protein
MAFDQGGLSYGVGYCLELLSVTPCSASSGAIYAARNLPGSGYAGRRVVTTTRRVQGSDPL